MAQGTLPATLSSNSVPRLEIKRSVSISSTNIRQFGDFDECGPRPELTVTSDPDLEDLRSSNCVASYPASELPFASEAALESEISLLTGLSSTRLGSGKMNQAITQPRHSDLIFIKIVKSILTRKKSPSPTTGSSATPGRCLQSFTSPSPSHGELPVGFENLVDHPVSHKGISDTPSTISTKVVRFACGEGAVVTFLTHSAEDYDRSPLWLQDSLQDLDERERSVQTPFLSSPEIILGMSGSSLGTESKGPTKKDEGGLSFTGSSSTTTDEASQSWSSFAAELRKHFPMNDPGSENEDEDEVDV